MRRWLAYRMKLRRLAIEIYDLNRPFIDWKRAKNEARFWLDYAQLR